MPVCRINSHIPQLTHDLLSDGTRLSLRPRPVMLPWLRSGDLVELETELAQALARLGCVWKPDDRSGAVQGVLIFSVTTALRLN